MLSFYGFLLMASVASLSAGLSCGNVLVLASLQMITLSMTTLHVSAQTGNTTESCCPKDKFECDNGRCISPCQVCNGFNNCGDMSDECNCQGRCGSPHHFLCDNGKCFRSNVRDNGRDDCGDGSDEGSSKSTTTTTAPTTTTTAPSRGPKCLQVEEFVDPYEKDEFGWTMLILALNWYHPDYSYLINDYDLNELGDTPEDAVRQLFKCYEEDNRLSEMVATADTNGDTPLCHAARMGTWEMVSMLLDANAPLESKCYYERTPLFLAVMHNKLSMVKAFLDLGANTSVTDSTGYTLVDAATYNTETEPYHPDVEQYLLDNGHITRT